MKGRFFVRTAAMLLLAALFFEKPVLASETSEIKMEGITGNGDNQGADISGQGADNTQAAGGDNAEELGEIQNPSMAAGTLKIDDANIYNGMNHAYKDGYEPSVYNNTASIVIPLVKESGDSFNSVTASLNLGNATGSPFVYKNYQKTFYETAQYINGSSTVVNVFLIRFDLELSQDRYNGIYPVEVQAAVGSGMSSTFQSFTVYVRITDGKPALDEAPTSQPIIMISKSELDPKTVKAGETFEVKTVLKNTSESKAVQNMALTVSWSSPDLALLEDSNMFYIDHIDAGQTKEMVFKCAAGAKTADGKYDMRLDMSYDTAKAETLTAVGTVQISVAQPMEVELEVGDIPEDINAGDSLAVPLQVLNLGRGTIYNVRCTMKVPGLISDTSAFLGNMEGGSAAVGELKVFAGTKKMSGEATEDEQVEQYGPTSGKIQLVYEDENGKEYTSEYDVATRINPLEINAGSGETEEKEDVKTQWWIAVAAGAVIILAGGGIPAILYLKKRKMR